MGSLVDFYTINRLYIQILCKDVELWFDPLIFDLIHAFDRR